MNSDIAQSLSRFVPGRELRLDAAALAAAQGGREVRCRGVKSWLPFQGPRIINIRTKSGSNVGIPGISESTQFCNERPYARFSVRLGKRIRSISSKRIGRAEALRRAIRCRAQYELAARAANAAIQKAREAAAAAPTI